MAQGFQITNPRMRFFDSNGAPLALGKLYSYEAGTSTPLSIYSNSDLTSTHTNPAILSASGEITIFVPSATLYKFDLYDANDVHQSGWPVDGVEALPAPDPPAPTPSPVPTGGLVMYGGTVAPSGYLLCNGALISRSTYSALFTAIGTSYGAGDGSTTFGLPDMRGRFPLGLAASGTGSTIGGTGGAIDHTHTGPSHTHTGTVDVTHTHNVTVATHTHNVTVGTHTHSVTAGSHTHSVDTPQTGWTTTGPVAPSGLTSLVLGDGVTTYYQPATPNTVTSGAGGSISTNTGAGGSINQDTGAGGAINQNTGAATISTVALSIDAGGTGVTGTANAPFQTFTFIIKT